VSSGGIYETEGAQEVEISSPFERLAILVAPKAQRQTAAWSETDVAEQNVLRVTGCKRHVHFGRRSVDPIKFDGSAFNDFVRSRIQHQAARRKSGQLQIVVSEDLEQPPADVRFSGLLNAIAINIVKFLDTESSSVARPATATPDFEIIGLGAAIGKGTIGADPNLVLSTGIIRVIVAGGSKSTAGCVQDRTELITADEFATRNGDRPWSTDAQNGAIRRCDLNAITAVGQASGPRMRRATVDIDGILASIDVEIDAATRAVGGEDRAGGGGSARSTVGATNTAAIAKNAIAMPPVNWVVAIGWRRQIVVVVDIIGRGFFLLFCC
jgi:hypothetical protein